MVVTLGEAIEAFLDGHELSGGSRRVYELILAGLARAAGSSDAAR